jgi:hypothetical protein
MCAFRVGFAIANSFELDPPTLGVGQSLGLFRVGELGTAANDAALFRGHAAPLLDDVEGTKRDGPCPAPGNQPKPDSVSQSADQSKTECREKQSNANSDPDKVDCYNPHNKAEAFLDARIAFLEIRFP